MTDLAVRGFAAPQAPSILAATDDSQAVAVWLAARGSRTHNTRETYAREARKLVLWAQEQGLSFASLKLEDVHRFYEHLRHPPPHWLRPRKPERGQALLATQVLAEPANDKGIEFSRRVLSQLFTYLCDAGYLARNVFRLSARPAVAHVDGSSRNLDLDSWTWLWRWICEMPRRTTVERRVATRARWVFALLYHTGLRREEVANGLMADFVRADGRWTLAVVGKGEKRRTVTINSALCDELALYRTEMGLPPNPTPTEDVPLVVPYSSKRRLSTMTPRAVGGFVTEIAQRAARDCVDEHIQARVAALSTHWMRHTNASHRMRLGASLKTTQDELGHADPKTTMIYVHADSPERQADAERLTEARPSP
jgi:integrase/recombinase XerC